MLRDLPVVAFVPTRDLQRARAFYETTLGFAVVSVDAYAVALRAGHGATIRVVPVKDHAPAKSTILGWATADIDAALADLRARGVEPMKLPFPGQDARGVMTFPGGDQVAWFHDPDGNTLSVTQHATT